MMLLSRWLLGLAVSTVLLSSLSAATVHVNIVGNTFVPKVVTVNAGDTVVWTNAQNVHTVSPGFGTPEPFCGGLSIRSCGHTFTNLGSFNYLCNFHELSHSMTGLVIVVAAPTNNAVPPSVAITSPAQNTLLAAHADFSATVNATDADGTVASVTWQTNGVTCTVSTSAPFALSGSGLPAGQHSLRAIATDSQSLSTTSAPVSLRVVAPPVLRFDLIETGTGQFEFQTVPGVNYILESAVTLTNFSPQATNAGNGSVQNVFSGLGGGQRFFRLRLE